MIGIEGRGEPGSIDISAIAAVRALPPSGIGLECDIPDIAPGIALAVAGRTVIMPCLR